LRLLGFLVLFFLWTWQRIDPALYYDADPVFPPFLTGGAFFRQFLAYPGGPIAYAAAFLSQLFAWSWLGALVLTAIAGLTCWAADGVIRRMVGDSWRWAGLVPGVLILLAYNRGIVLLPEIIGPLAAVLALAAYLWLSERGAWPRMVGLVVLSPVLYYAAGGPYLLFAGLAGLYELGQGRRLPGLLSLLAMEGVPYFIGCYGFALTASEVFRYGLPLGFGTLDFRSVALQLMYGFWVLVGLGALAPLVRRGKAREPKRRRQLAAIQRLRGLGPAPRLLLGLVGVAALAVLTEDRVEREAARLDDAARHERWDEVLVRARGLPLRGYDRVVSHQINRALYETGRLPYDMLAYPQGPETLMLDMGVNPDPEAESLQMQAREETFLRLGDLDLQLGLVNKAEREAHEALTVHGPHPEVLRRLATVNLVKRQPEAAAAFTAALAQCVRPEGGSAGIASMESAELERVRSVMLVRDAPWAPESVEDRCRALLRRNRRNRMAFEYLMAYYLLTHQPGKVVENLGRLRDFGYPAIPRLYEEAVLVEERQSARVVDLGGRRISAETLDRWVGFGQTVDALLRAGARESAKAAARARYGDSYFYYAAFGETGAAGR